MDFLKKYYPILKGAATFCSEWLVENSKGELVTPVSTSPENAYLMPDNTPASVCEGSTMDIAIIRSLFSNTIQAAEILQTDMNFRSELIQKRNKLKKYQIGTKGQLLEWDKEYEENEPQHRHVSHLLGLYPGHDITMIHQMYSMLHENHWISVVIRQQVGVWHGKFLFGHVYTMLQNLMKH